MVALLNTPLKLDPSKSALKTGVYAIRNRVNGKVYVGSAAKSFASRWAKHRHALRKGCHDNDHLQKAWIKYGESAFEFLVLCRCSPEWCLTMEQIHIGAKKSTDDKFGYNMTPVAGSMLGFKHSPETCRSISEQNRGRSPSPETLERMRAASKLRRGIPRPKEVIQKQIATFKANMTEERRDAARKRILARTPEQWAAVRAAGSTKEAKDKHRAALIARAKKMTKEDWAKVNGPRWAGDARAEMSRKMKGHKKSAAHNAAILAANKRPEVIANRNAFNQSAAWKEDARQRAIANWKNPEYRAKRAATIASNKQK